MSRIQRLKQHASAGDLSTLQVAEILGVEKAVVYDLVHTGQIECVKIRGNGRRRAAHRLCVNKRNTYHFEPRQVLSYIIQQTTGDRKTLFAEIELLFPKWLSFAKLIAKQSDEAAAHHEDPEPPRWMLDTTAPRRATRTLSVKADPFAGCPEMFPLETLSRPTPETQTQTTAPLPCSTSPCTRSTAPTPEAPPAPSSR